MQMLSWNMPFFIYFFPFDSCGGLHHHVTMEIVYLVFAEGMSSADPKITMADVCVLCNSMPVRMARLFHSLLAQH